MSTHHAPTKSIDIARPMHRLKLRGNNASDVVLPVRREEFIVFVWTFFKHKGRLFYV
jgi:hypothetical protein